MTVARNHEAELHEQIEAEADLQAGLETLEYPGRAGNGKVVQEERGVRALVRAKE